MAAASRHAAGRSRAVNGGNVRPLPTRDGVGPSCVALPSGPWSTIAACLVAHFPLIGEAVWLQRIAAREVVDENGEPVTPQRPHRAGLRVYYYRSLVAERPVPFRAHVLFQDDRILVVDKPHFLPVTPSGTHLQETLLVRLKRSTGIDTLAPVHRLDRETAGLVMFTLAPAVRGAYQRLFAERSVEKHYECIAPWRDDLVLPCTHRSRLVDDPEHFMRVCEVAGAANSETTLSLIERNGNLARYALQPTSGHRHQLRAHCAALGIPIVGDRIYPELLPFETDDHRRPLQLLARVLRFVDPIDRRIREFESSLRLQSMSLYQ